MNALLALASALLLTLSFPRFSFSWLIAIALAPLLIACGREGRWRRRFLLGWLTGAACLAGITDWIRFVVSVHGGLGLPGGWLVFFLYCAAKGLYFGLFAALAGPLLRRTWAVPAVAALWVAVDLTAGSAGYVWVTLGNAGADMGIPMRLAPLTGVHGLSFLFVIMSASVATIVLRRPRRELLWLLLTPLPLALPPLDDERPGAQSAVVVQPAVDPEAAWTGETMDAFHRKLVFLSMQGFLQPGPKPALTVWPEAPAPLYYDDDPRFRQHAGSLARITRAPLLMAVIARTPRGAPLNSALLLNAEGAPLARYDKIHLVPFGEFVPWPFGFAGKIVSEVGDFVAGERVVVARLDGHALASFICYESAFPALARHMTRQGAEVLFNLSNDAYFGRSPSARGQHLLLVRMRAAENSRWILRATNDGITAAVDPAGRVVTEVPQFRESVRRLPFSYSTQQTFYTRHGDWFGWSCCALATLALFASRRGSGQRSSAGWA